MEQLFNNSGKKAIILTLLGLNITLLTAGELNKIPFGFYADSEGKEIESKHQGELKIFFKDREGLTFDSVKGDYWNYEYTLKGTNRQSFLAEVKKVVESKNGTLLFSGEDYLFFKLYDNKNLYWGKIVYFKEKYEVSLVEEKSLKIISVQKNLLLKNLKFDSNKATLQKGAEGEIERIFEFLIENSSYVVEIQGHTDSSGSDNANLRLSQKRAERVREALVKKGISPERIQAKGYGESQPISDNSSKEGRRRNRRVELKVVSE